MTATTALRKSVMIHHLARTRGDATEHYLTAIPAPGTASRGVFGELAAILRQHGAYLLHERIFHQTEALEPLAAARRTAYGNLDDGVEPTWLGSPEGRGGLLAAVQVHAVSGIPAPEVLPGNIRVLRHPAGGVATISALRAPGAADPAEECRQVYERTAAAFATLGVDWRQLARTWLWLDPIYTWYADLNRIRNGRFRQHGLIAEDGRGLHLPASTGIGLHPEGAAFALEAMIALNDPKPGSLAGRPGGAQGLEAMIALNDPKPSTLAVAGNQRSALGYGSAFSRAASLETPSGPTWYVSGTAAIDTEGRTVAEGDIVRQVALTIDNVKAVLRDCGTDPTAIVQGVAYCLSPAVAAEWRRQDPGWPLAEVQADICRSNLLFEIELAACPGARRR